MTSDDPDPPSVGDPQPFAAREGLRRHRERSGASAGLEYLRTIAAEEQQWLEKMVVRKAARYHVDQDDLLQDLYLSLLECNSIDVTRSGLRAWLTQRATWKAAALRRMIDRQGAQPLDDVPEPPAPDRQPPGFGWDVDEAWGLSRDEAQIIRLLCWDFDVSMQQFSELAGRTYAKTRQDRSRGLRKIEKLFDLTPQERAAYMALRHHRTYPDAAIALAVSEDVLRVRVGRAIAKIRRVLGRAGDHPEGEC